MLKIILIALGVVVLIGVVIVALQPADFRITRGTTISAPPAAVFAHVNDLHKWEAWSPWEKMDPALKRTYEGAPSGTGAIYQRVGNAEVGQGSMTITESQPSERIGIRLEFVKPFTATNAVEFTFQPAGEQTVVSWTMSGRNNFAAKAAALAMNMDKMLGGQFDEGLANLKRLAETEARK